MFFSPQNLTRSPLVRGRNKMEKTQKEISDGFLFGGFLTVVGFILIAVAIVFFIKCSFDGWHLAPLLVGLIFASVGLLMLNEGIKAVQHLNKLEQENLAKIEADHAAEIVKINEQKELDRIKIFDPSTNQKRTFVVPVLADLAGGIYAGMLHTDVPLEVMGVMLDFYLMIEGNPDPAMTISGLPQNPGGVAGKTAGLSIRSGLMISGLSHYPNTFVIDKKDINVVVVIIYNAEITGIAGQSVRITHDISGMTNLTPLDQDMLKCEFVPIDVLKHKVHDALTRLVISELPEYLAKNKP